MSLDSRLRDHFREASRDIEPDPHAFLLRVATTPVRRTVRMRVVSGVALATALTVATVIITVAVSSRDGGAPSYLSGPPVIVASGGRSPAWEFVYFPSRRQECVYYIVRARGSDDRPSGCVGGPGSLGEGIEELGGRMFVSGFVDKSVAQVEVDLRDGRSFFTGPVGTNVHRRFSFFIVPLPSDVTEASLDERFLYVFAYDEAGMQVGQNFNNTRGSTIRAELRSPDGPEEVVLSRKDPTIQVRAFPEDGAICTYARGSIDGFAGGGWRPCTPLDPGAHTDTAVGTVLRAGSPTVTFLHGIASSDVAYIRVKLHDGSDIRIATVSAAGFDARFYAFALSLRETPVEVVAFDLDDDELGRERLEAYD